MTTVFLSTSGDSITSPSNTISGTGMIGWGSSLVETLEKQEGRNEKSRSLEKEKEEEGQAKIQHERVRCGSKLTTKEGRFQLLYRFWLI